MFYRTCMGSELIYVIQRVVRLVVSLGDYRGVVMITTFWNIAPCSSVTTYQTRRCHITDDSRGKSVQ
jgi:hypothetical protein